MPNHPAKVLHLEIRVTYLETYQRTEHTDKFFEEASSPTPGTVGMPPEKSASERAASAAAIRAKHPDRIPVIVDKRAGDSSLPEIDKARTRPQPHEPALARVVAC